MPVTITMLPWRQKYRRVLWMGTWLRTCIPHCKAILDSGLFSRGIQRISMIWSKWWIRNDNKSLLALRISLLRGIYLYFEMKQVFECIWHLYYCFVYNIILWVLRGRNSLDLRLPANRITNSSMISWNLHSPLSPYSIEGTKLPLISRAGRKKIIKKAN